MKEGDVATIFLDIDSKKSPEGEAKLIKKEMEDEFYEIWTVKFYTEGQLNLPVLRKIRKDDRDIIQNLSVRILIEKVQKVSKTFKAAIIELERVEKELDILLRCGKETIDTDDLAWFFEKHPYLTKQIVEN